ncbi:MAG: hypothetical protein RL456_1643 [Pseudomonadota bacterium]|jgi:hypothetical protein
MSTALAILTLACVLSCACAGYCLVLMRRMPKRNAVEKIRDGIVADYRAAFEDIPGAPQLIQALANDLETLQRPTGLAGLHCQFAARPHQAFASLPSARASLVVDEAPTIH